MPKLTELVPLKVAQFKPDGSRWPDLFGVELELESLNNIPVIPMWSIKEDQSLRNGVEYVLDRPYAGASLEDAIKGFYAVDLKWNNSVRTSTHIHVNVSDCDLAVVQTMTILMYAVEDALFDVVGASRKWSGYAMALSEMDPVRLRKLFSHNRDDNIVSLSPGRNQDRYYGFNFASVSRHGTVEFRYFPGGPGYEELCEWLDFVTAIKKAGLHYNPLTMVEQTSTLEDFRTLLQAILPDVWYQKLTTYGSIDQMFRKFNEVGAYVCDPEQLERREQLVFITPALMKYLRKKVLNEEGAKYIENIRDKFGTVTAGDWAYYLEEAVRKAGGEVAPKLNAKKPKAAAEFDPFRRATQAQAQAPVRVNRQIPVADEAPAAPVGEDFWYNAAIPPAEVGGARPRGAVIDDFVAPPQQDFAEVLRRRTAELQRIRQANAAAAAQQRQQAPAPEPPWARGGRLGDEPLRYYGYLNRHPGDDQPNENNQEF